MIFTKPTTLTLTNLNVIIISKILVTTDLGPFLNDLKETVRHRKELEFFDKHKNNKREKNKNKNDGESDGKNDQKLNDNDSFIDLGAFLDAKGHYMGFCFGCEKWHTGKD
jgi:hypothetical protein